MPSVTSAPPAPVAPPAPAPTAASSDQPAPTQDLAPEFANIASMLSEAFGQPVAVSVERPVTTSDDEAASELVGDRGTASPDDGFTDEASDDADDMEDDD